MKSAIEIIDASVYYGRYPVLDRLSLIVEKGVIAGLVGPNGVGKTTLLRLIAGLVPGSASCVRVADLDYRAGHRFKKQFFFIDEMRVLDLRLSGMDYLRYVKGLWQSSVSIERTIAALGIKSFVKKPLSKLSSGMRQQVILSLAFASGASVILLDEPMNSLDPGNTDIISQQLLELKQQGATILLSTHLLPNIDDLASIVFFLKDGRVVQAKESGDFRSSSEIYREIYGRAK
jgi:ABC-2 type transport system ATP-binding protein